MRYAFVARERAHYPLGVLCRLLGVSRSGLYDYLGRQMNPGPDPDASLRRDLRRCHAESRGLYGRPRLVTDLRELGHAVGPKRVTRLMREEGLRGKTKCRARPRTTDSSHARPVAVKRHPVSRIKATPRFTHLRVDGLISCGWTRGWLRGL